MRIIAGTYGGRGIRAVAGLTTRPTTDRVREAWASTMSSLLPDGFDGLKVLDAFAGSGALGLEALSRGAENVVFCEINRMAAKTLRANIDTLKIASERYSVLQSDIFAERTLSGLERSKPFDAVFSLTLYHPTGMSSELARPTLFVVRVDTHVPSASKTSYAAPSRL